MICHEHLIALAQKFAQARHRDPRLSKLGAQFIDAPTELQPLLYEPIVAVVLQGKKRSVIGGRSVEYGAGETFTGAIEVPVLWQVIEATREEPFVSISMALDPARLQEVMMELEPGDLPAFSAGFGVSAADEGLADALGRMLRLVDHPQDIAVLGPLWEKEILYRLLRGPQGAFLRPLAGTDSRLYQVRKALSWMKDHFAHSVSVSSLASMSGMSVSVFHRHFRAVTAMTPLQYQKQLRLHEARRTLFNETGDATSAAYSVGYTSLSQFSREYRRLFGASPSRDVQRFRPHQILSSLPPALSG